MDALNERSAIVGHIVKKIRERVLHELLLRQIADRSSWQILRVDNRVLEVRTKVGDYRRVLVEGDSWIVEALVDVGEGYSLANAVFEECDLKL